MEEKYFGSSVIVVEKVYGNCCKLYRKAKSGVLFCTKNHH